MELEEKVKTITAEMRSDLTDDKNKLKIPPFEEQEESLLHETEANLDFLLGRKMEYSGKLKAVSQLLAPIVLPIKKIIRKSIRFVVEPMADTYNENRLFDEILFKNLIEIIKNQNETINKLSQDLTDYKLRLEKLEAESTGNNK